MSILVIVEHNNNELLPATLHTVNAANQIGNTDALVIGNNCQTVIESTSKIEGINEVLFCDEKIYENAKNNFNSRLASVNWNKFYLEKPFKNSGQALYHWSPIADDLKILDKEIVLNSIMLKWNLVENEFKDLTKNLSFD